MGARSGNGWTLAAMVVLFSMGCGPMAADALRKDPNWSLAAMCSPGSVKDTVVSDPSTGNSYEPTLAANPNGTIVASYFTYPRLREKGTEIGYRVSKDFGATWGDPQRIASPQTPHAADS